MTTDPETPVARALLEARDALVNEYHQRMHEDDCSCPASFIADPVNAIIAAVRADATRATEAEVAGLTVEMLAKALHETGLNTIGKAAGNHGKYTDRCICNLDAAAILAALPAPRPPEPDRTAALVEAAMNSLITEPYEHVRRAIVSIYRRTAAELAAPEPSPVADGLVEG